MPLNKFGQSLQGQSNTNSILSKLQYGNKGLKYTVDGNIDAENLKISNVKLPTLNKDATNREYVENKFTNVLKLYKNLEQATIQALHKKQDRLKINLKAEIANITYNTDELKKQTEELNKHKTKNISDIDSLKKQTEELNQHKTKIISDIDSLEHISAANIKVRQGLSNKIEFIEKFAGINRADILQANKENKIQIEDLTNALKDINNMNKNFVGDFNLKLSSINSSIVQNQAQVEDLKNNVAELKQRLEDIFKVITVPANASSSTAIP